MSSSNSREERGVVFLFPGVGERQKALHDLYEQEEAFRRAVERCCTLLSSRMGLELWPVLFPERAPSAGGEPAGQWSKPGEIDLALMLGRGPGRPPARGTTATALDQPATFVIEYALAQLLLGWGIRPAALLGYSLGEYVAACMAGVLSWEQALLLVARRARLIEAMPPGAMLAVPLPEEELTAYLSQRVCLAAVNGPRQVVLSGPLADIERVEASLRRQEVVTVRLQTKHAFHSSMLAPLREELTAMLRQLQLHGPRIPYISNVTGTWITREQATDPAYWAEHMCRPVRFAEGLERILQAGAGPRLLLEVGPGRALSSMVRQHPACGDGRNAQVLATLPAAYERPSASVHLQRTRSWLWLLGYTVQAGQPARDEERT
jgi:acyl transferase domain-containing protein